MLRYDCVFVFMLSLGFGDGDEIRRWKEGVDGEHEEEVLRTVIQ